MKKHYLSYDKQNFSYNLSVDKKPALIINPGEYVVFETMNAFSQETNCEKEINEVISKGNHHPFTGPVFINGTEPGMTIGVHIHKIELAQYAYTCISRSSGVLKDIFNLRNYCKIKIDSGKIFFKGLILDVYPSLGGVGLGDPKGTRNGATCRFGGNLDFKWLTSHSTIYLPVGVIGGLLYMGDVHALQGNGEPSGIALEASGKVHTTIDTYESSIPGPIIDSEQGIMIVGYGESFDLAVRSAVEASVDILACNLSIRKEDAYILLGFTSDIVIGHLTGRIKSVAILVPHDVIKIEQIIKSKITKSKLA